MNTPPAAVAKRIAGIVIVLGIIVFIIYGLYLANRPVVAPLQGQVDGRYIDISPKILGRVANLHVREGDEVKPGQLLVTLDSPEVEAKLSQAEAARGAAAARQQLVDDGIRKEEIRVAKAQWEQATSAAGLAQTTYKRTHALFEDGLVSQQKDDEARTALETSQGLVNVARAHYDLTLNGFRKEERTAALEVTKGAGAFVQEVGALAADINLKSPISAEVDKVVLHQGELAPPGFPIISLVNLDDVWAVFNLREDELTDIKIDTRITARVPSLGNRVVTFGVYYISPKGEYATWRATRQSSGYDIKTFEVRARPLEKIEGLRPGMSVLVDRG
jgi:HlyD family secretion protein